MGEENSRSSTALLRCAKFWQRRHFPAMVSRRSRWHGGHPAGFVPPCQQPRGLPTALFTSHQVARGSPESSSPRAGASGDSPLLPVRGVMGNGGVFGRMVGVCQRGAPAGTVTYKTLELNNYH